ncbi:histidine kinase dimerization/phospho-acceptor domain-containing protein [Marinicaulis aureus]|uniref:histidine kinase n=1 Tax=Hyphococcus aureus TaxID=2666033 RepID=A0ABW1KRY4_9PROT
MREKLHRIRLPRNMSFIWKAVVLFIAGIVAIELLYLRHEQQRSAELRDLLTETYSISLELENEIGYGGLIHNFKNYLLRPAEERYYIAARSNAENATTLIDNLEENAQSLGLSLTLTDTRKMIAAYRDRLETISSMAEDGDTARDMDNAVRYTDDFALAEINKTMNTVSGVVIDRLTNLAKTSYLQLQVIFALIAFGVIYFSVTLNGLIGQATTISYKNKALHKSNADLSRSNLALQQFAGLASHDLKSPVRRIALLADMARQHMKEPQTVEGYILQIKGVAERMNVLVSSLLDFTKTGFRAPRLQHVDVNAILCETISDMSEQIEAKMPTLSSRKRPL